MDTVDSSRPDTCYIFITISEYRVWFDVALAQKAGVFMRASMVDVAKRLLALVSATTPMYE